LAPVGYRLSIPALASAAALTLVRRNAVNDLMRDMERHFNVRRAVGVSSGKASLTVILQALHRLSGRTKVIVPAYTCYSVPSAIVKAGMQVVPSDLAEYGFDYDYDALRGKLGADVLCVLSVHLFGIPSDTQRLKRLCHGTGIFVVEDAAQAMGASIDGAPVGTIGDVGFFSLGRGKNITCGSGGIALTNDAEIARALDAIVATLPDAGIAVSATSVVTLLALTILLSPIVYWLPAGLPFLRLGETIFHDDFPLHRLARFQALLLRDWWRELAALDDIRRANGAYYRAQIAGTSTGSDGVAHLRYPVVLADPAMKDSLLNERDGGAVGVSAMYPASVGAIPQLQGRLGEYHFPRAERMARTLVTLPTHPLVTIADRERICAAVKAVQDHASEIRTTTGGEVVHMTGRL
jgi:dTDP-4-amino-4,6-dideoxygalactose transaminase